MVLAVLLLDESIHALDDVLSTQVSVRPGDSFAFDDRVRIMLLRAQENFDERQRDVGTSVWQHHVAFRSRFRARQHHDLLPRGVLQRNAHPVPQALGHDYLSSVGIHVLGCACSLPTCGQCQQNDRHNLGLKFNELSAQCRRCLIGDPQTLPPEKLSATTASASSSAAMPIQ